MNPFPPARAALAEAIDALQAPRERLDETHKVLAAIEAPPAALTSRDAGELRADLTRLHEITNWLGVRGGEARASLSRELKHAEDWLGEVAAVTATAEERLSRAEQDYTAAAHAARQAHLERDRAVWAVTLDAAGPALRKLGRAVISAHRREARLWSLVVALREIGHRNTETNSGSLHAAEAIERAIKTVRSQMVPGVDPVDGRSLIERLQTDPLAAL